MSGKTTYESLIEGNALKALLEGTAPQPPVPDVLKFRRPEPFVTHRPGIPLLAEEQMQKGAQIRALRELYDAAAAHGPLGQTNNEHFAQLAEIYERRRVEIYESLKARYIIENGVPEDTSREGPTVPVALYGFAPLKQYGAGVSFTLDEITKKP